MYRRRQRLPTFSRKHDGGAPPTPPKPRAVGFRKILNRRLYFLVQIVLFILCLAAIQINMSDRSNQNNVGQEYNPEEIQQATGVKDEMQDNKHVREPIPTMDLDHVPPSMTGAFANCRTHTFAKAPEHPHQRDVTIACHTTSYRVEPLVSSEPIIIGVLSAASGSGPKRRESIRATWANGHTVLFLVAGPWEDIQDEYDMHRDIIWINEEEVYDGERSVLTFKTFAFVKIVHQMAIDGNLDIKYAFKTDDDSYVHVQNLYQHFFERDHAEYNFWGWCQRKKFQPLRDAHDKWAVSFDVYPEPLYPRYCQGAGFALSKKFIDCAAGDDGHISNMRFMPFEDVAMGLIAQRCGIVPTMVEDKRLLHMYRTDTSEERKRVNGGYPMISAEWLTIPDMKGRILQHRIHSAWDMLEHHRCALDPDGYKEKTNIKWYVKPEKK